MPRQFIRAGLYSIPNGTSSGGGGGGGGGGGTPDPGTGFTAAWGTRPVSAAVSISNQNGGTVSGKQFKNIGNDVSAIRLTGCSNMIIEQNDFDSCCQGITLTNCTNITIRYNRAYNITGPYQRNGTNRGNFTQWIQCSGGYVGYNKVRDGNTEDLISMYKSNGTQANPILIEYNQLENETYVSASGTGVILGDGGGDWQVAQFNKLLNPAQVGMAVAGGHNNRISDNIIYGDQKSTSNIGCYVADYSQTSPKMSNIEVSRNRIFWKNSSGQQNPFWTSGDAGTIIGQSSNTFGDSTIDRSSLVVTL